MNSNPIFRNLPPQKLSTASADPVAFNSVTNKAALLVSASAAATIWSWISSRALLAQGASGKVQLYVGIAAFFAAAAGLIFLTVRRKSLAPVTAPVYALVQGLLFGAAAAANDWRDPGVAILTVLVPFVMFFSLLISFRSGLLRTADSYNRRLLVALLGASFFYAADFALGAMGKPTVPLLSVGLAGFIVLSVIPVIAGICLVFDFRSAARYAGSVAPEAGDWYLALGLALTLAWLYVDILLLSGRGEP